MSILNRFKLFIQQHYFFQKEDYLLLAVSGGVDSVVLCELCRQAGFSFSIAHCNFQLRGDESERDEQFVRELAKKYEVSLFVKKFNTNEFADQNKLSIQVAARELRYSWFEELLQEKKVNSFSGGTYLLTAHHTNDSTETLLMNFFKGTGIKGLQGILPKQKNTIRPLIFLKKEEIISFAKENNLSFVEDSSNTSDKYTRNYFRNQLIPSLEKVFPQVEENLQNNLERFNEIEILYRQSIQRHKENLLEIRGNEIHIPVLKLLKSTPLKTIIYEIIKDFQFTAHQVDEVVNLLNSETGKYVSSSSHKIIKNRNWLIIAPIENSKSAHVLIENNDTHIEFELGTLKIKREDFGGSIPNSLLENVMMITADELTFPLMLRRWKQGDYFYPLGMPKKKKKLSKFFIDQKLSLTEKEKIWVIESRQKIVWVIGKRIDDRFKITPSTKNILRVEFIAS